MRTTLAIKQQKTHLKLVNMWLPGIIQNWMELATQN